MAIKRNLPLDSFHTTFLSKAWTSVGKCTSKYRDTVVHPTGIPMEDFLRHERPTIDLLCRRWCNGTATLVRDMDMVRR
jgi:hypothetical protein